MAEGHIVYQKCPTCDGTGINKRVDSNAQGNGSVIEDTCPKCDGNRYLVWGWMTKDDATLPDFLPECE